MPPKPKPADEFIEALLDSRVVEALAKALMPCLQLTIDEAIGKKLEGLTAAVRELKSDNARQAKQYDILALDNVNLQKLVSEQSRRLNELETYSRRENLIIRGLPESSFAESATASSTSSAADNVAEDSSSAIERSVVLFCRNKLNIDLKESDISSAHRLKKGIKDDTRPLIVRFVNRSVRDKVMRAKKVLRSDTGTRIFITDHLTHSASALFFEARSLVRAKKIESTWTINGRVFYKKTSSPAENPTLVTCAADLLK